MKIPPKITETEWEIMRVIWAGHPVTATEIVNRLARTDPSWHPKTARALVNRLVQRGVLDYERRGRVHVYRPLFTEQECVAAASESFLERVFGGSLQPMLAFFVEQRRLTKRDLAELHELLENRSKESSKGRRS
jgi:BlaI family penicillinase repressor